MATVRTKSRVLTQSANHNLKTVAIITCSNTGLAAPGMISREELTAGFKEMGEIVVGLKDTQAPIVYCSLTRYECARTTISALSRYLSLWCWFLFAVNMFSRLSNCVRMCTCRLRMKLTPA